MKKIMFNDRYGLTQAVIERRKTMTRRMISGSPLLPSDHIEEASYFAGFIQIVANDGETLLEVESRYKVGEVVAVAQSYNSFYDDTYNPVLFPAGAGWENKMFVKAELMPHQIRITGIKCEQWFIAEEAKAWVNQGLYAPIGSFEKCLLEHLSLIHISEPTRP